MRREGRLTGKAGKAGKPSNHSRMTGKCKIVGCQACHDSLPVNKSRGKGKGRIKRLVFDIPSTHLISDWHVSKPKGARKLDADTDWDEEREANHDGCGIEPEGWALSISQLLDTALEHTRKSRDARCRKAKEEALKFAEDSNDDAEVPDIEAFKNECEVFKCEIEAGGSPASVAGSEDSWSGIELSDADESDLGDWEDDWSLVGDEIAV